MVVFEGTTTRGRKWSLISEPRPRGKAPGKTAKQIKWKIALLRQEVTDGCYIDKNKAPPPHPTPTPLIPVKRGGIADSLQEKIPLHQADTRGTAGTQSCFIINRTF